MTTWHSVKYRCGAATSAAVVVIDDGIDVDVADVAVAIVVIGATI